MFSYPGGFTQARPSSSEIDTLRGIACVLVLLFHAVLEVQRWQPRGELAVLEFANQFVTFLRMPLFMWLAGYVYAGRPVTSQRRGHFLRRKAERLLIPLAFVTFVSAFAHAVGGSPLIRDLPDVLLAELSSSNGHLWFLQALFVIYVLIALGLGDLLRSVAGCAVAGAAVAIALASGGTAISFFSIGKAIALLPYFILGAGLQIWFAGQAITTKQRWSAIVGIILVLALRSLQADELDRPDYATSMLGLFFVFLAMPAVPVFAWLGRRSMPIYLLHILVLTAITRHLPGSGAWMLVQAFLLCLAVPLFLQGLAERWAPGALPLFGAARRVDSSSAQVSRKRVGEAVS